jgi:hypothetical protein
VITFFATLFKTTDVQRTDADIHPKCYSGPGQFTSCLRVHGNLFEKVLIFPVGACSEGISLPLNTSSRRLWLTSIVLESWWSAETTPVPKLRMIVALFCQYMRSLFSLMLPSRMMDQSADLKRSHSLKAPTSSSSVSANQRSSRHFSRNTRVSPIPLSLHFRFSSFYLCPAVSSTPGHIATERDVGKVYRCSSTCVKFSRGDLGFKLLRSLSIATLFIMTCIGHSKRNIKDTASQLDSCRDTLAPGILAGIGATISDPKHLAKMVRYRFLCSNFWVGFGTEHMQFSLERIQAASFLRPIVFDNSRTMFFPCNFSRQLHFT